jgi:hypothetical protein
MAGETEPGRRLSLYADAVTSTLSASPTDIAGLFATLPAAVRKAHTRQATLLPMDPLGPSPPKLQGCGAQYKDLGGHN